MDFSTAGYTYSLSRWAFEEREVYQFVGNHTYGMPTAYRILGQNIIFKPAPTPTALRPGSGTTRPRRCLRPATP